MFNHEGTANANIHVGNGLGINASLRKNNVIVKSVAMVISTAYQLLYNTQSNKLATFFCNIKQVIVGVVVGVRPLTI